MYDVRRFLGITGFFRRFVAGYATVALPLTNLTKGGTKFIWEEPQPRAFEQLKNALMHAPVMAMFNPNAYSTEVYIDASVVEICAMMLQRSTKGDPPTGKLY